MKILLNVVLSIVFFILITPIGFITRLIGIDLIDQKIDKKKYSYWKNRKNFKINLTKQS